MDVQLRLHQKILPGYTLYGSEWPDMRVFEYSSDIGNSATVYFNLAQANVKQRKRECTGIGIKVF